MNRSIKSNGFTRTVGVLHALLVGTALLQVLTANRAFAEDSPVLRVNNKAYFGKTYGEWVVAYWQWAMSFPTAASPWLSDEDGSLAGLGQSGPVWFLGGTAGNSVTRTFTIPAGKAILLPVHQWIFGATVFDCDPSVPGVPCDVHTLKQAAADAAKAVALMEVSIDGQTRTAHRLPMAITCSCPRCLSAHTPSPEDAKDLTQEFFFRPVEKNYLESLDRETGKFRSFLLVVLKCFLANEWDRANRQKRGGGRQILSLDEVDTELRYLHEPVDDRTPEKAFEQRWALTLLEQVVNRLQSEMAETGKAELFRELKDFLGGDTGGVSYSEVAARCQMNEGALRVAVHRLRRRYREILREEIAGTVTSPEQVDDEIRHLFLSLG